MRFNWNMSSGLLTLTFSSTIKEDFNLFLEVNEMVDLSLRKLRLSPRWCQVDMLSWQHTISTAFKCQRDEFRQRWSMEWSSGCCFKSQSCDQSVNKYLFTEKENCEWTLTHQYPWEHRSLGGQASMSYDPCWRRHSSAVWIYDNHAVGTSDVITPTRGNLWAHFNDAIEVNQFK